MPTASKKQSVQSTASSGLNGAPRRTVYTQYLPFAQLLLDTPFRTTLRGNAKTPPMQGPGRLFSAFEYQGLVILVPLCNWVAWTWSSWELALQGFNVSPEKMKAVLPHCLERFIIQSILVDDPQRKADLGPSIVPSWFSTPSTKIQRNKHAHPKRSENIFAERESSRVRAPRWAVDLGLYELGGCCGFIPCSKGHRH